MASIQESRFWWAEAHEKGQARDTERELNAYKTDKETNKKKIDIYISTKIRSRSENSNKT